MADYDSQRSTMSDKQQTQGTHQPLEATVGTCPHPISLMCLCCYMDASSSGHCTPTITTFAIFLRENPGSQVIPTSLRKPPKGPCYHHLSFAQGSGAEANSPRDQRCGRRQYPAFTRTARRGTAVPRCSSWGSWDLLGDDFVVVSTVEGARTSEC